MIAKLAVIAGMRPGEIFALTWGRMAATYADIRQRVYRGAIDTPKTDQSVRQAALSEGLLAEIEVWREFAVETGDGAWVFPSERMTPLSKDNCWRRSMYPKLANGGSWLGEFSGHAPDARNLDEGARGGWKAGRRSARPQPRCEPERLHAVAGRKPAGGGQPVREKPPGDVIGAQTEHRVKRVRASRSKDGAGDGTRTRDVQLGKLAFFGKPRFREGGRANRTIPN